MGSKRLNLSKILSTIFGATSLMLVSIFIAICLLNPVTKVKAEVDMDTIKNSYNIHFVSAKTRVQRATSYTSVTLQDKDGNDFTTYNYNYVSMIDSQTKDLPEFYNVSDAKVESSDYGNIEILVGDSTAKTISEVKNVLNSSFVPEDATHFKNTNGNLEEIYYDNIVNNDFVMIDNYNIGSSLSDLTNIENFYLAFGSAPILDDNNNFIDIAHTPLSYLSVDAYLYNEDGKHIIDTEGVNTISFKPESTTPDKVKTAYFFNQYFDLRNLKLKNSEDEQADNYYLKNTEGRYEFKFTFTRYDEVFNPLSEQETFKYTFYLIDSANYTEYPEFSNATLGSNQVDAMDEYFYHFEKDNPVLTYNPSRINISYTRENNEIGTRNITSDFKLAKYSYGGNTYKLGILTFYQDEEFFKRIYILAYNPKDTNNKIKKVEYLYLSDTENINVLDGTIYTYEKFESLLKADKLTFEYKLVQNLENNEITSKKYSNYYTDETIETYKFDNDLTSAESDKTQNISIETDPINQYQLINNISWNAGILNVSFSYDLTFEELGIHSFTYSYTVPTGIYDISYIQQNAINTSRNIIPNRYYLEKQEDEKVVEESYTQTPTTTNLVLSGFFSADNSINLLDKTYNYNPEAKTLTIIDNKETSISLDENRSATYSYTLTENYTFESATYKVDNLINGNKLTITIPLTQSTYITTTISTTSPHGVLNENKDDVKQQNFSSTNQTITNEVGNVYFDKSTNISQDSFLVELTGLGISKLTNLYQNYYDYTGYTFEENFVSNSIKYGETKLHMMGSIAYFSKKVDNTDSGYAKMQLKDSKYGDNYFADATSIYAKKDDSNGIIDTETDRASEYKGFAKKLLEEGRISQENIIFTDMQVMWKNFSSLYYSLKISQSYVYRYDYTLDKDNNIELTSIKLSEVNNTSIFTKDTYCQTDGLYEVVVLYSYDHYKENSELTPKYFYQLFTFIIDNSSPSLNIEVENPETKLFEDIGYNIYTNKNVRISWQVPTYFQNNVYINVNKTKFNKTDDKSFLAEYNGENDNITPETKDGDSEYVNNISTFRKTADKKYYEVIFKLPENNAVYNYNLDGTYLITLYYGDKNIDGSKPNISENFVIDRKNIDGLKVLPITTNEDGSYRLSDNVVSMGTNQQIINTSFTFRYNKKASGATIYTYWYKIPLTNYGDFKNLLTLDDDGIAVTTNKTVEGNNVENNTPKFYNFTPLDDIYTSEVSSSNCFITEESALYYFEMYDDAGNKCRYVIFCDSTSPMFIVEPAPDNANNIVSDTTRVFWGDYKAIKVTTDETPTITTLDNYTNEKEAFGKDNITNLEKILSYLNTFQNKDNFNNVKIELTDDGSYYILVPIEKVEVNDEEKHTEKLTDVKDFYFFPVNPVSTSGTPAVTSIKLLQDKSYELVNNSLSTNTIKNVYGEDARTFLSANYLDNSENKALRGVYGSGLYIYYVFDKLGNSGGGDIWMNLDQTQTMAYGTFNYTDSVSKAMGLTGEAQKSYSMAKLYISSKENIGDNDSIPDYNLTYKYYPYDVSYFDGYSITNVELSIDSKTNETYLNLTFTKGNESKTVKYLYMDSEGQYYPAVSYPYNLEGDAIIKDNLGNPKHIYSESLSSYETEVSVQNKTKRVYSSIINATSNLDGNIVTQEGLYIFKREYTDITEEELGNDSKIVYRIYYVDRNGIINVASNSSSASELYSIGEDINFVLGLTNSNENNYSDPYKKYILAENIQSNITSNSTTQSNTDDISAKLFTSNKVNIKLSLTSDKYNYVDKFAGKYNTSSYEESIQKALERTLLNTTLFERIFKLDLKFYTGTTNSEDGVIINETATSVDSIFNIPLMQKYIKYNNQKPTVRDNFLTMYYGMDKSSYFTNMSDQSGYISRDPQTNQIISDNTQPNALSIDFKINHNEPYGENYGKYYGSQDYDEDKESSASIPINNTGNYTLISHYIKGMDASHQGQLQVISDANSQPATTYNQNGATVKVLSTNNETLVFLFSITNDEYMAKIDPNNIKIWKGSKEDTQSTLNNNKLIFNRSEGNYKTLNYSDGKTSFKVEESVQTKSFIHEKINNIDYYAIIVFDNNLDEILNEDEINLGYDKFRLLDSHYNDDDTKYFIEIKYLGDTNSYIQAGSSATLNDNYGKTTYEIIIDRIKPMYNISRLMYHDKYIYNNDKATEPNETNYETIFNKWYTNYYGATYNEKVDFTNSDLENYFFALGYKKQSKADPEECAFKFKKLTVLDSNTIYIRRVDPLNYYFSYTPDDYVIYNSAIDRGSHPQFVPTKATNIDTLKDKDTITSFTDYYALTYDSNNEIDLYDYVNKGILIKGGYYEIVERDEAGNYRVYGIYLADSTKDSLSYEYSLYNNSTTQEGKIDYESSTASISGFSLKLKKYSALDLYLKATININSVNLKIECNITYDPIFKTLKLTNGNNVEIKDIQGLENVSKDDSKKLFIDKINEVLTYYHGLINDKNTSYYSKYGYDVDIDVIDRAGIPASYNKSVLTNFEINYTVAGAILEPDIRDNTKEKNFILTIPALTGSTYITKVQASKFSKTWNTINLDCKNNYFNKQPVEFRDGEVYYLETGVYKFEITDNFNRTNVYFYEYGISSSQTGGSLSFAGNHKIYDGYNYTSNQVQYTYDSSVYDVYIKYTGLIEGEMVNDKLVYTGGRTYTPDELTNCGISSVVTVGNQTTITFMGVSQLYANKYHIKTILARTSTNYQWGDELNSDDIFVYDNKIAIYSPIQSVAIRNMKGNILDTSGAPLTLTEDFELITTWANTNVFGNDRIDFNSRIVITRTFNNNGVIDTVTSVVNSGFVVTEPGDYKAYVLNDLGTMSKEITFTRGEGTITMYAVYAINKSDFERKLTPSSTINSSADGKSIFHYYITNDYFNYSDLRTTPSIEYDATTISNLIINENDILSKIIGVNKNANKYIDVRVNSNLNIFADIYSLEIHQGTDGYFNDFTITYKIYSHQQNNDAVEDYIYRYVSIHFVNPTKQSIIGNTKYKNNSSISELEILNTSTIQSVDSEGVTIQFTPEPLNGNNDMHIIGNTIYIDRYYNDQLIETKVLDIAENQGISFKLKAVGLHSFRIRDLSGRTHNFNTKNEDLTIDSKVLNIYLINQIIFNVNDKTPINNQVFNSEVKIDIVSKIHNLVLYEIPYIGISVYKNGIEMDVPLNNGHLAFNEQGHYSIQLDATTEFEQGNRQQISSTYNFEIVRKDIARNSFNISKGTNFAIEKVIKYIGNAEYDLTNEFKKSPDGNIENPDLDSPSLIWLTKSQQQGSIFEITLKSYDENTLKYIPFTFTVWINNEIPTIESNIKPGEKTKDVIKLSYNPGLIYSQVGTCRIEINGYVYVNISEESLMETNTITISNSGDWYLKIISDDGTIISTYKYTKNEPMNSVTKIVLVCAGIGVVVLVVLFVLIRKKGKYR